MRRIRTRRWTADMQADITDIEFGDGSFDFLLCNHIREHVPDDRRHERDVPRAEPRGVAIMQHPLEDSRERTFEDPSVTSPKERKRLCR